MSPRSVEAPSADKGWKAPDRERPGAFLGGPAYKKEKMGWPPLAVANSSAFLSQKRISRVRVVSFCDLDIPLKMASDRIASKPRNLLGGLLHRAYMSVRGARVALVQREFVRKYFRCIRR